MTGMIEMVFFLALLYWLFSARAYAMVGVITTRVQEVYTSWSPAVNSSERKSIATLRNLSQQGRKKRALSKENENKLRENSLYQIKEQPTPNFNLQSRPFMGLACKHCAPATAESQVDPIARRKDVRDILRIGTQPNQGWATWCPHLAQNIRLKKFVYPQVAHKVMSDERLQCAIDEATVASMKEKQGDVETKPEEDQSLYKKLRDEHEARAKRVLLDMRSKLSDIMLRLTSWVLYKLLPCFLTGVAAHPAQVDMLRLASEKAGGAPLIFLPLHRSHLDYILISFILLNNNIRSPLVAAGNNLRIPFFGSLLRGLGAFYIKRKIDPVLGKKDIVYRAVLHTYLQKCLEAGHNVEFFIEGGRTRTGKPCMPKGGILSVIVDAYMDGTIDDALLVPVSMNYERLVDGNFVQEQQGYKKKMESFGAAISAIWSILNSKYGIMRLDFNEPFSIRELVKAFHTTGKQLSPNGTPEPGKRPLTHNPSTSSLYGTDIVFEEHRTLVENIARHVIFDCANATAIMSTNAVAFLLLTRFREGVDFLTLSAALDTLRAYLSNSNRDLGFTGDSKDVVDYAINLLGPALVTKEKRDSLTFIKPVTMLPNVIELAYYSNCLLPHFALESIVVTCLHSMLPHPLHNNSSVNQDDLLKACHELSDTLRYEFILHKPCQNLESRVIETIDNLCTREILVVPQRLLNEDEQWGRRFAAQFEDENNSDDEEYASRNINQIIIKPNMSLEAVQIRGALISVIEPLLHSYICTAKILPQLREKSLTDNEFAKLALKQIQEEVSRGQCIYGESVSIDSVRNAIKLLQKWGIIDLVLHENVRYASLGALWDNEDGVQKAIEKFERFVVPYH